MQVALRTQTPYSENRSRREQPARALNLAYFGAVAIGTAGSLGIFRQKEHAVGELRFAAKS